MSVALNAAFSTAMNGRSKDRSERVAEKMNLSATVAAVRCNAGGELITNVFAPLGYTVTLERQPLDPRFPLNFRQTALPRKSPNPNGLEREIKPFVFCD